MPRSDKSFDADTELPVFPKLQTGNLFLREIADADAADLLRIHGDAEHMRWFGSDPVLDIDGARKLIQTFAKWREEPASGSRWALELRSTASLEPVDCSAGIGIGKRAWWATRFRHCTKAAAT